MIYIKDHHELRDLLGYNEVAKLNGMTFEELYFYLKGGERHLELEFDKVKDLIEMVKEDIWEETSNPAFQSC